MESRILNVDGTRYALCNGERTPLPDIFLKSTDPLPTRNIENATILYLMDYNELTDEQRATVGSKTKMFDADTGRWLDQ